MRITKTIYSDLLKDIQYRKGQYFIRAVENFYSHLPSTGSGKITSAKDKYQLYRLEANIRWNFYRYIENIERILMAALSTKNTYLNKNQITNEENFKLKWKMFLVSGKSDFIDPNKINYFKLKNNQKIIGGAKHATYFMEYIKSSQIFNNEFELDTNDQKVIRKIRNCIQHFDFILDKNLSKDIKNFIKLFSDNFQQSLSVYILIEIMKIITRWNLKIKIIEYINKEWELFNDEISKDFIQEIKADYKDNKSRIEPLENEIPEKDWEDHCKFKLGLEVAEKYSNKIKIIIQQNTIEIQNNRDKKWK